MKIARICILILLVAAVLMALLIFWPSKGDLSGALMNVEYADGGSVAKTIVIITNGSNKPAFGVQYTITVKTADGVVVGSYTSEKIRIMMPGQSERIEVSVHMFVPCDDGDVEVSVSGYLFS